MKIVLPLLLALTTLTATAHADGEPQIEIEKKIQVIVATGGLDDGDREVIRLDGDDLDVGESRQFFTDDGKEVLVTRTEDGVDIEIDGESIDIGGIHEQHMVIKTEGDEFEDVRRILVETLGDEADHNFVFHGGGAKVIQLDGSDFHWTTSDEDGSPHAMVMKLQRRSAADHLEASGALDDLDEATRRQVLDALKQFDASTPHFEHFGHGEHDIQIIREHRHDEHEEY
ncbi:MAG: hypothetical protein AAGE94_05115 [Acidobacteriota bacterium]